MPVSVDMELVRMSQDEFGAIAYRVMREVFAVHGELGRLFDEQIYQHALAARIGDVRRNIPFFPWETLDMHPYHGKYWAIGSCGLTSGDNYQNRRSYSTGSTGFASK